MSDYKILIDKLNKYVDTALDSLYKNDIYLINNNDNHASERSIVFRFAHYLCNMVESDIKFKDISVDCEYNRNIQEIKRIDNEKIYPDIIIHHRGDNKKNLMIIEVKGCWNKDQTHDEYKVGYLADKATEYKYRCGKTIMLGKYREEVKIKSF